VLFNFSGGLEILQEPMDCKAGTQMTTLESEFIVKSIFVLKFAATGVDDASRICLRMESLLLVNQQ
jgi:hypothetical protein